jgi:large subunit ribosomal protein L19
MKANKYTRETIRDLGITERNFPDFRFGDTIRVSQLVKEGSKERSQEFEGTVIAINNMGNASTFTVRKIASNGIPVERIFPYYSPLVESIAFVREGAVRRAKLYFMRERVGKNAQVKEKIRTREQKAQRASANAAK